jgi:hypothetical protein
MGKVMGIGPAKTNIGSGLFKGECGAIIEPNRPIFHQEIVQHNGGEKWEILRIGLGQRWEEVSRKKDSSGA